MHFNRSLEAFSKTEATTTTKITSYKSTFEMPVWPSGFTPVIKAGRGPL
jgi:hypothetical protein